MPEPMVYIPIASRVDQPLEGETSRTLPDQVGNVAGASMDELADRIIQTGGGHIVEGPLKKVTAFWLSGMSCDGCSISALGATEPSVEELLTGSLPGVPMVVLHHYATAIESGDRFTHEKQRAERGELDAPYVIIYEGSIPDENLTVHGEPWSAEGALPLWAPEEQRRRIPTAEWVRRLAPGAAAVIAIGTCATWGGIPAAWGNPTGAMSVMDFLGKDYRSALGVPVVNVPGCAPLGDNFTETGAVGHMGGCMVAGGACIGCTMPGFPDKFTPFYKKAPGSTVSTVSSKLLGSFIRPLRRISQLERNRELRWHDHVPSGWAPDMGGTTITHKVMEFFYDKLQYAGGERPGRQKPVERYRSGWVPPPERAYGQDYQVLPAEREQLARERGAPRRPEVSVTNRES